MAIIYGQLPTPSRMEPTMAADRIDAVVSLSKRRGFVFPSSEIYGGTRSAWDYGPLGVELKENIKREWWKTRRAGPRRHRRPRLLGHPVAAGVGGIWSRRGFRRPADRVPVVPQAIPRRPTPRGVRGAQGPRARRWARPSIACPNCGTKGSGPSRVSSTAC